MIQALLEIDPIKIMTFSPFFIKKLENKSLMILINTGARLKQEMRNSWEIKTNSKIHSKLAIGNEGFIIGSWNFSENSTNNMHESILKIEYGELDYEEMPDFEKELNTYFERLWARSHHLI